MGDNYFKRFACTVLLASTPFVFLQAEAPEEESNTTTGTVDASWQENEDQFIYSSFNTYYSCSGIETSVEKLLVELGAKDVKARAIACGPNRLDKHIPVKVKFKTLSTNTGLDDVVVKAKYQEVDFSEVYRRRNLREGDSNCDLVRGVSKSLMDNFEHETIRNQGLCSSGYSISNDVKWKIKVLMPSS